jgi:hypothetical protein
MPANVINSGTPLAPGASAPLWTELCDSSSNLTNVPAPPPLAIPVPDQLVNGVNEIQFEVLAPDMIESINVTGFIKGKLNDQISLTLKHPVYGSFPIIAQHAILGPLTSPYPLPGEVRLFNLGETIPAGYVFKQFVGNSTATQIVLPDGQSPTDYYYYYYSAAAYEWQVKAITPGGASSQVTVPAHRYPYTPDYNYDNVPGNALINVTSPIVFRGFRYRLLSVGDAEPSIVKVINFANLIFDNGPSASPTGYYSTGVYPWQDFNNYYNYNYYAYAANTPFSETLYNNYGAHDWLVIKVVRAVTTYLVQVPPISFYYATRVVDTYTVQFIKWADLLWEVDPLSQITWESIVPPTALFQFYPADYNDTQAMAERTEAVNAIVRQWAGQPAEGTWTLEVTGASTPIAASGIPAGYNTLPTPTVTPGIIRIAGMALTLNFKTNQPYLSTPIAATTPSAGVRQAICQAQLRAVTDDRAMIAILCGIAGSTTMGIICGYALQRVGLTGEVYNVTYFIATTCNINHVNMTRRVQAISFDAQDWANAATAAGAPVPTPPTTTTAFSTKGNAGEGYVFHPTKHRIYPVRGQIGLQVQIQGTMLKFMLLGNYPVLTYQNPTVALVNNFQRYSLNA